MTPPYKVAMFAPFMKGKYNKDVEVLPQSSELNKGNKPQAYLNSPAIFGTWLATSLSLITTQAIGLDMSYGLTRRELCLKIYLQLQL